MSRYRRAAVLLLVSLCAVLPASPSRAGSFSSAGETLGVDLVKHPVGYSGTGGDLPITVCLDPNSPFAADAVGPVYFAIQTWNQRQAQNGNLDTSAGVPGTSIDFESTALRALGLCLGLDDPSDSQGFAQATNGVNNAFERNPGADSVPGTRDDVRGDDQNLMWFRFVDNHPFAATATPDSTSYTRNTAILPEGDSFAATPTRTVAAALAIAETEAVMVAGLQPGEAKRQLAFDDLAMLRYAESGLDEAAGTSDDYRVRLIFVGLTETCTLRLTFDVQAALAACFGPAQQIAGNHYRFATSSLAFSDAVLWHFDDQGLLFLDGFESGGTLAWSSSSP